jgi:peroxiredoxin
MLACLVPSPAQGYFVSSAMGPQLRTGATALTVHLMTDTGHPGTGRGPHGREATARSAFCPKDHQQHLELAANYPKIRVAYTQIVTISTDNILKTNEFRDSVGAQWTFLSDAGRHIQKDLDIAEYTDFPYDPMIPYTLVLKPGLVIYSVYNGYWFWGRPSFEDLRRDLREVTREIRPDWDLAAPGLRAAWEAGDHSLHHRYQQADPMRTVTPMPVRDN